VIDEREGKESRRSEGLGKRKAGEAVSICSHLVLEGRNQAGLLIGQNDGRPQLSRPLIGQNDGRPQLSPNFLTGQK
jgi:hypothetical protein